MLLLQRALAQSVEFEIFFITWKFLEISTVQAYTFLTQDGRMVRLPADKVRTKLIRPEMSLVTPSFSRMPSHEEQKLCIGSSFLLQATNGHNPSRRVSLEGFCQSCDYLY